MLTTQFNQEMSETGEECSICTDSLNSGDIKKLSCGHKFHLGCIERWSQENQTCPVCRKSFSDVRNLLKKIRII